MANAVLILAHNSTITLFKCPPSDKVTTVASILEASIDHVKEMLDTPQEYKRFISLRYSHLRLGFRFKLTTT